MPLRSLLLPCLLASLTAQATITTVWTIGVNGGNTDDMEHESDADPSYHFQAGDYTGVNKGYNVATSAYNLPGQVAAAAEPLRDSSGTFGATNYVAGSSAVGLSRALVNGSARAINLYHQLNAGQAAAGNRMRLVVDLLGSDGGQAYTVDFAMNGTVFKSATLTPNRTHTFDFVAGTVGTVSGGNVLSLVKTGGPAVWGTHDFLRLQIIDPGTIVSLGSADNSQAEFEQEGSPRNDANFYYAPGDYTGVTGTAGAGIVATEPEGWTDLNGTVNGFPRALVPGAPAHNIFFQLTAAQAAMPQLIYRTSLISLGASSTHDLVFSMNGVPFHTMLGVTTAQLVDVPIPTALTGAVAGGNVISVQRTGGNTTGSPWIQFDYIEVLVPEPGSFALLGFGALLLRRRLVRY